MEFRVDCTCGNHFQVSEGAAGVTLRCKCGKSVSVPSLGDLRRSAGLPACEASPELVLEHDLHTGELAAIRECVRCDAPVGRHTEAVIECERVFRKSDAPPWWAAALAFLIAPFWYLIWRSNQRDTVFEFGKDKIYTVPFPVCEACRGDVLRNEAEMKKWLRVVPTYARLLEKFPDATVHVAPPVRD